MLQKGDAVGVYLLCECLISAPGSLKISFSVVGKTNFLPQVPVNSWLLKVTLDCWNGEEEWREVRCGTAWKGNASLTGIQEHVSWMNSLLAKLPNYQVHFSCSLTLDFKNPIRMQYKIKEPLKTVRLYLILSYHQSLSAWQEKWWHLLISTLSYLSWLKVSSPQLIEVITNALH